MSLQTNYKGYNIPNVDTFQEMDEEEEKRVAKSQPSVDEQINTLMPDYAPSLEKDDIEGDDEVETIVESDDDDKYLMGTIPTWYREKKAKEAFSPEVMKRAEVAGLGGIGTQQKDVQLTPALRAKQARLEEERKRQAKTLPASTQVAQAGPSFPKELRNIDDIMKAFPWITTRREAQRFREQAIKNYVEYGGHERSLKEIKDRPYGASIGHTLAVIDPTGYISATAKGIVSGVEGLAKLVAYSPRFAGIYTAFFRTEGNAEPSFFLKMATSPLSWKQGISAFHKKMGDNTIEDMEARIREMPVSDERQELMEQMAAFKAVEGPNAFWEIMNKLITDHSYKITAWDDISNFGKVFYPQAIGDAVADGIHNMVAPIHQVLEIPEDQKDMFHEALTFGGSMLVFTPATLGVNIFKLGAVAVGRGTQQVAKLGLPYLHEGNKIYNVIKPFTERITATKGPWGKPALFDIPKAAKGVRIKNTELLNAEVRMGMGGAVGYATGDTLFGGGEYDSMKYLFGIAGSISSLMKHRYDPTTRAAKGTWRVLNGLAHSATWAGHKIGIGLKVADPLRRGEVAGWTNAFLRSRGFTSQDIKNMHHEAQSMYDNMIGTPEGIEKAKDIGLAISDGQGGYTANLNFTKSKYLATNKKEIEFYGQILKEIDDMDMTDPSNMKFKEDLRMNMNRGYQLFQKLSRGLDGANDVEKMEALGATISDLVALNNIRNYQHVLISKLNLGLVRGGWKKGHLITQLEKTDRALDLRIEAFKDTLKSFKLGPDAGDIHRTMNAFFQKTVKESIDAQVANKFTVTRMLKAMQNKVLQKYSAKSVKEAERMKEVLRIGEYGVYAKEGGDTFAYQSDNFLYGRMELDETTNRLVGAPTSGHTIEAYKRYNQTGLYIQKRNTSDDMYATGFRLTRGDNNEVLFHLDASPLFRVNSPLESGSDLARSLQGDISQAFTTESKRAIYKNIDTKFTESPLLLSFRRRGLQAKRKEFGDDTAAYENYLEDVFHDNPMLTRVSRTDSDDTIKAMEDAILTYEGHLDDVPALMTVEEWHFLRSRLNQMKTQYFQQGNSLNGNMINYSAAKGAVKTFEKLFDDTVAASETGLGQSIKDALQAAQTNYQETIAPWHNFKTRAWLKENVFPENYFSSFFNGGMQVQGGNKRLFEEMFLNPATGKMDEKAVDFLRDALGKAYTDSGGNLANSSYDALSKVWKPIFQERYGKKEADEIFNVLKKSKKFKEELLFGGNTKQFYKDQEDRINDSFKGVLEWFDEADEVTATALNTSVIGRLAGYMGVQDLPPTAAAFIKSFGNADSQMKRSLLYDFLLGSHGTGEKASLSISYGMKDPVRRERLDSLEEMIPSITKDPTAPAQIMEHGKAALPSDKYEIDKPLNLLIKYLDNKVAAGEMTSIQVEKQLDGLRTMLVEEIMWRNFNYTKQIKITSAVERAKAYPDFFERGMPHLPFQTKSSGPHAPIIELRQDMNIKGIRQAWDDNIGALQALYNRTPETREQFKNLQEMMELSINMRAVTGTMNVAGVPTDVTFSMAMGRMYNAMKGVMSIRYLIMEGGAVQARKVHADMFMRMFTDPSAALIAKNVFMSSKPQEKWVTAFRKMFERSLGYEMNDEEKHQLMRAVTASRTGIVNTSIWLGLQSPGAEGSLALQQAFDYPKSPLKGQVGKREDILKRIENKNRAMEIMNKRFNQRRQN